MTFLTPVTHRDLWPHHCLCVISGLDVGHCDQIWLKSDVGKYVKKTCCLKEAESSKKQVPAQLRRQGKNTVYLRNWGKITETWTV